MIRTSKYSLDAQDCIAYFAARGVRFPADAKVMVSLFDLEREITHVPLANARLMVTVEHVTPPGRCVSLPIPGLKRG